MLSLFQNMGNGDLGNAQPFPHPIPMFVLFSAFSGKRLQGSAVFSPRVLSLLPEFELGWVQQDQPWQRQFQGIWDGPGHFHLEQSLEDLPCSGARGAGLFLALGTLAQHPKARAHIYLQSTKEMEAVTFKWLNLWSGYQRGTSGAA